MICPLLCVKVFIVVHNIPFLTFYFHRLSPSFHCFVSSLSFVSLPSSFKEALASPGWKLAMDEEMTTLRKNQTWEITSLPPGKHPVSCHWVYTMKYHLDSSVERLKARLIAKGYTQTYGVDYCETFSPIARLNSVKSSTFCCSKSRLDPVSVRHQECFSTWDL
jgi:hypothetical protein